MLVSARSQRRREDGYMLYNEAVSLLDRAATLNPNEPRFKVDTAAALQEFSFAAACVGETFLVRLLKRGGKLPQSNVPGAESASRRAIGEATLEMGRLLAESSQRITELELDVVSQGRVAVVCRGSRDAARRAGPRPLAASS